MTSFAKIGIFLVSPKWRSLATSLDCGRQTDRRWSNGRRAMSLRPRDWQAGNRENSKNDSIRTVLAHLEPWEVNAGELRWRRRWRCRWRVRCPRSEFRRLRRMASLCGQGARFQLQEYP